MKVPLVQTQCNVGPTDRRKTYSDVVVNVFAGVRIMPDDEPRSLVSDGDLRARPWLTGVTMSAGQVKLAGDMDEDEVPKV